MYFHFISVEICDIGSSATLNQCSRDDVTSAAADVTIAALDGDWFVRMQLHDDVTMTTTVTALDHVFVEIVNGDMLRVVAAHQK